MLDMVLADCRLTAEAPSLKLITNQSLNLEYFMAYFFQRVGRLVWVTVFLQALVACHQAEPQQEPVRAVKVMTVGAAASDLGLEFSGDIRARFETSLGFRVAGKLLNRSVELGQRVKLGQELAQIDPQDYRLAAQATAAQVLVAQTNRDLAEADLKRYQDLFTQGFISAAELERRQASFKAAQAQWEQAQAQNAVQGNQSNYTRLLADGAGVITAVEANPGQVLAAGQSVVRLALDGARDVVFSVPEDKLPGLKVGAQVDVLLWNSAKTLKAQLRDVSASADPITRTYVVKAMLPASLGADASDVVLGATVTVTLPSMAKATGVLRVTLPTSALRQEGGATCVWLLDAQSMTVKSQTVDVHTADGNQAVVSAGLKNGDQVVISGVHVLTPGQKVSLYAARD
jgi:RND family efflux transporter MFP subunit